MKNKQITLLFSLLPLLFLGAGCQFSGQEYACAINGERYEVGDNFKAADGCNTCTCGEGGQIGCTEIAWTSIAEPAIDECQTDNDCLDQGIDTSLCANGNWSCLNNMCEYACSIE